MKEALSYLILLFFAFSVLGWIMEVILKYIQYHRFINRGFLAGPYCPVYGAGAVLVTVAAHALADVENSYSSVFLISFVLCGALEYFVSLYLEKRFHARWWDYSTKPMNLNGRIWIGNLLLFGLGGTIIVKVIDPFFFQLIGQMSERTRLICADLVIIIIAADFIASHFVMKLIRVSVENSEADNTEAIGKEIRMLLRDRSVFYRRVLEAYPEAVFRTQKILNRMKEEQARILEEANNIIAKQEELLTILESKQQEIKDNKILRDFKDTIDRNRDLLLKKFRDKDSR